jgi:hypothetical protein
VWNVAKRVNSALRLWRGHKVVQDNVGLVEEQVGHQPVSAALVTRQPLRDIQQNTTVFQAALRRGSTF